ncbi:hypothetical protein [Paraglaciecola sp. L1A13]|uniref:hypothetical protein n=1 Tax=Paraglaciecola sp. L1A13 TaxID=2686359 RepID=UPI00131DB5AD
MKGYIAKRHNLESPLIGNKRELEFLLEADWQDKNAQARLEQESKNLRLGQLETQ